MIAIAARARGPIRLAATGALWGLGCLFVLQVGKHNLLIYLRANSSSVLFIRVHHVTKIRQSDPGIAHECLGSVATSPVAVFVVLNQCRLQPTQMRMV